VEILSRGAYRSPDDLSKLYLSTMAAYAGAAEITKWLIKAPTDPSTDPSFERIHRGGFFVWLWLAPLLFAYGWRISNPAIPMPEPLKKITIGLVGIFFLKAASRKLRHNKHGVIDIDGDSGEGSASGQTAAQDSDFTEVVYQKITASPNGLSVTEGLSIPDASKSRLYRVIEKLLKAHRITRKGTAHRPDVRYHATRR